jgi:outer membrane scaffolding protein for murein synthesis (MipA/OmpV family)
MNEYFGLDYSQSEISIDAQYKQIQEINVLYLNQTMECMDTSPLEC